MNVNIDTIQIVITAIIFLAVSVERGVEIFRPWLTKIKNADWQNVAKLGAAILLGFGLAFLLRLDILAMLGFTFPPVAGYAAIGLLASGGASMWHGILEWLKTIKGATA